MRACGRAGVRACGRAGVRACGRAGVRTTWVHAYACIRTVHAHVHPYIQARMGGGDLNMLKDFVEAGLLGKKTGKGFFDYSIKEEKPGAISKALGLAKKFER